MMNDERTTGDCHFCGVRVELIPGAPGSLYQTPYWRHDDRFITRDALDVSEREFAKQMDRLGGQPAVAQVLAREAYDEQLALTEHNRRRPHSAYPA